MARQAREERGKQQPDWLAVVALVDRSKELASQVRSSVPELAVETGGLYELLGIEKERAKTSRDRAWALWIVSSQKEPFTKALLDSAEEAYQRL